VIIGNQVRAIGAALDRREGGGNPKGGNLRKRWSQITAQKGLLGPKDRTCAVPREGFGQEQGPMESLGKAKTAKSDLQDSGEGKGGGGGAVGTWVLVSTVGAGPLTTLQRGGSCN